MAGRPILVPGATGSTGRRVSAHLTSPGHPVRRASRHGDARFAWTDRETWAPALEGVERVTGRPPKGFRRYVEQAWEGGAWREGRR
ncbi:hypothetical protein Q5530_04285 [Saccharothrix sp. BKS2]|uniref:hypothetical protein n=1 Tax=Saccharothrix sp. BKS2 TaxID=3064400 RepID=UPI0039EB4BA1